MNIKKGDNIIVLAGKDKGKKGKVEKVFLKTDKVLVTGINVATKHQKPRYGAKQVGRITINLPLDAAKVAIFCDKCGKGVRVGHKVMGDNRKARVCKKCGEVL